MGEKIKCFLIAEYQLIDIEGIMVLENHHSSSCFREESWIDTKASCVKGWWETESSHSLKIPPHKIFTNYKGRNSKFTVERPRRSP